MDYCAKRVPIFYSLSNKEIEKITKKVQHLYFKKGQLLVAEGEYADSLYIIHSGKVKLIKLTVHGKEQILHLLTNGDFFGERNLFANTEGNNFSAYAMEDTKICLLLKKDFDEMMIANPEISIKILKTIMDRLSHTEDLAKILATKDPEVRIAHLLDEFCAKFGTITEKGVLIDLPITREEISNYVGLTRETISRKLSKFADMDLLTLIGNKQILVKNQKIFSEWF
ncbi:Crp/Fnr family transcriptional regulator [Niallia nealsonii]|nr:Crp/Fnr family transcriptional regulator [Niallia nealsonii]